MLRLVLRVLTGSHVLGINQFDFNNAKCIEASASSIRVWTSRAKSYGGGSEKIAAAVSRAVRFVLSEASLGS